MAAFPSVIINISQHSTITITRKGKKSVDQDCSTIFLLYTPQIQCALLSEKSRILFVQNLMKDNNFFIDDQCLPQITFFCLFVCLCNVINQVETF